MPGPGPSQGPAPGSSSWINRFKGLQTSKFTEIKKVYIASPLFTAEERELNARIDEALKKDGFDTFLPQRDGFLYVDLVSHMETKGCTKEESEKIALELIKHLDIYQVCEACDATVLNMNGRVPDEGAVSETAMAFRSGKPLVIYKDDARSLIGGKDNPLVTGLTGFEMVDKVEDIPVKLRELEKLGEPAYSKTIGTARELFEDYNPRNKDLATLVEQGKKYFLT